MKYVLFLPPDLFTGKRFTCGDVEVLSSLFDSRDHG